MEAAGARGPPELAAPLANLISTAKTALTSAEELTTPPLSTLLTVVHWGCLEETAPTTTAVATTWILVLHRGPPRLSIFTLKSATWRACGHALDLPRARSAAPLLQNLIVCCCCCAIQAPRRPGLGSRGVRRRSIPRLDSAMEVYSGAHSYGCKARRSKIHRLSHPRSRCSHNAAPSGWAGRLPAAELP